LEKGLAYRKEAPVNWCPRCESVLANEEAEGGKCWRCGSDVIQKNLAQWFYKITSYADRLIEDLEKIEWPEKIKVMQENWIGKSFGTDINFIVNGKIWPIFTTRPDTIFGVTFMVVSAKHPRLNELVDKEHKKGIDKLLKKIASTSKEDIEELEKEGAFTGSYAVNPLTNEKVPVYAGNFVVADYGSGMVMAVPCHDQRDFEFAKKYNIPIKLVIQPQNGNRLTGKIMKEAYVEDGVLVNSKEFDGMDNEDAKEKITDFLVSKKLGKRVVNYKIRDWLISRQRYWGTPIPIIYCKDCGIVPVPEKELPVLLPEKVDFQAKVNPLLSSKDFLEVKCPKCGKLGRRETDTMGGFVDSSWYFLRYCDNKNKLKPFDSKKAEYWMPVDQYVGGAEHAVMHLMYARFFTKALKDLKFVTFDEPFHKLFNQGIVYKDGAKMSKSKGNVVFQTEISDKYGIDTARLFLMFVSSPDKQMEWTDEGVEGSFRIINRLIKLKEKISKNSNPGQDNKINAAIKNVTESIDKFEYPKAVVSIIGVLDYCSDEISRKNYESLLKLISPFCPHIAEELWHELGNKTFISVEKWPEADEKKINPEFERQEMMSEKLIEDINNIVKLLKEKGTSAKKVYVYTLPKEREDFNEEAIKKRLNMEIKIFSVSDKNKYDPQNKAGKAKPGKPAIYLE
jgi:leucyl-tRNA synthetase